MLKRQDTGGVDQSRSAASEALARANADHEQATRIAMHLGALMAEVERAFNDGMATPPPVSEPALSRWLMPRSRQA